jgi:lactoylglutathione lyase
VADRAFPVIYATDVERTAAFYVRLGFEEHFRLAPAGDVGYIGLRRGSSELAVVTRQSPEQLIGVAVGDQPRFELYVYTDEVDARVDALRAAGTTILRDPEDMPWGARVAYVEDPEGNPVALAVPAQA